VVAGRSSRGTGTTSSGKPQQAPVADSSKCLPGFAQLHDLLHPLATGPRYCRLISRWQEFCGISRAGKPTYPVVHLYFQLSSALGSEVFFLFPVVVWLAYPLATPLITCLGCTLPLGQLVKDMCHLPRPPRIYNYTTDDTGTGSESTCAVKGPKGPKGDKGALQQVQGVIHKLEGDFNTEYGMPSTHAMSGALSFCVLRILSHLSSCAAGGPGVDGQVFLLGLPVGHALVGIAITASVCCSRLYMGVHSLLDITAGLSLAATAQYALSRYEQTISAFVYQDARGLWVPPLACAAFILFYPRVTHAWSASYSTASELFGLWLGISLSVHLAENLLPAVAEDLRAASMVADSCRSDVGVAQPEFWMLVCRLALGGVLVAIGRTAAKNFFFATFAFCQRVGLSAPVPAAQRLDTEGQPVPARRAYAVEIPARIATMVATCMLCVLGVPLLWRLLSMV